jgi:hypothetical protein
LHRFGYLPHKKLFWTSVLVVLNVLQKPHLDAILGERLLLVSLNSLSIYIYMCVLSFAVYVKVRVDMV